MAGPVLDRMLEHNLERRRTQRLKALQDLHKELGYTIERLASDGSGTLIRRPHNWAYRLAEIIELDTRVEELQDMYDVRQADLEVSGE